VGELGGFGDVVIWRWDIMGIYTVYIYIIGIYDGD
jgi:hypothetical protein